MAKKRIKNFHSALSTALILSILVGSYMLRGPQFFNNRIPDVTEIPEDVKESIKNTKPQKSFQVPIFLYHYVEYVKDERDTIRKSLNILPHVFDEEVKTLLDAGYAFITLSDLADALDEKIDLPAKPAILTFDDGYRDFFTDVFPILKKYQVKAVVYVVPNFLNKPNNLDTWMLLEIAKSGLVEIGAHTLNHSYLSGLPFQMVRYEVEQSKRVLENILGIKIDSFAYPYGAFDNGTIGIVKKAGFRSAVTTIPGSLALDVNRFFLYRIRPGGKVGEELLSLVENKKLSQN